LKNHVACGTLIPGYSLGQDGAIVLRIEWDEAKARVNLSKHGMSFDEAQTVFADPDTITLFDDQHSDFEDRFIDIGMSATGHILVIIYTENAEQIHIISCRRALPKERHQYEQRNV
jgi:uncharacterized protein